MVFVEERKRGTHKYFYLVRTFRENGKVKKKSIFLGTDLNKILLDKAVSNAKVELGEIDFGAVLSRKEIKEFDILKNELNEKISKIESNNFYEHFLTEFTYDSNAIEGSSLTLQETAFVLFEGISPKSKPMKHIQEAKNHKDAFDYTRSLKQKKLSKDIICEIQQKVVKDTLPLHLKQFEGDLRGVNVRVGNHIAPPFYSVPGKLTALLKWFNKNQNKLPPVVVTAYFHSEFESIHPFVDGNGRTGRLLMNFMLKNSDYPPITIFFKYRLKYYAALEKANNKKDLKPLIKIIKKCYADMLRIYTPLR